MNLGHLYSEGIICRRGTTVSRLLEFLLDCCLLVDRLTAERTQNRSILLLKVIDKVNVAGLVELVICEAIKLDDALTKVHRIGAEGTIEKFTLANAEVESLLQPVAH